MKRLIVLVAALLATAGQASDEQKGLVDQRLNADAFPLHVGRWQVSSEAEPLLVTLTRNSLSDGNDVAGESTLSVYRCDGTDCRKSFAISITGIPMNLMVTGENDGALVVQSVTGSGFLANVFHYSAASRKPELVLSAAIKGVSVNCFVIV